MVKSIFDLDIRNPRLAKIITIRSPTAFRESIRKLRRKDGSVSLPSKRALVLAQNRARAILKRRYLSAKERRQMKSISEIKLPEYR